MGNIANETQQAMKSLTKDRRSIIEFFQRGGAARCPIRVTATIFRFARKVNFPAIFSRYEICFWHGAALSRSIGAV
ncbi:MAG: hypothetical protein ACREDV_03805 [Methylocella sp.]